MGINAQALAELIEQSGMTLREIEQRTGVDASTISEYRQGNIRKAGAGKIMALARCFGVGVDAIYSEEVERNAS